MNKVKKWWMPMLLGVFLLGTLVGVAGARANDRSLAAVSRRITIPAASFDPDDDTNVWYNNGYYILSEADAETQWFLADVVFPTGQAVVVESMTLYAGDNNASHNICLELRQSDVTTAGEHPMAAVCSEGQAAGIRSFTDSSIENNPLKHGRGVFLRLAMDDDTELEVFGVRIQYHHGTT